ncbi:protein of unknown function [Aminobacter niigataensis]|nr:protein of unknown function [Aminobacter niigataensis]
MTKNLTRSWLFGLALWLAALLAFALYSVETSRARLAGELEVTGRTLHRLISQRAAQHDAHMTSLIALTSGAEAAPLGVVRQVMESISRFYPRIAWIALVLLDGGEAGAGAASGAGAAPAPRSSSAGRSSNSCPSSVSLRCAQAGRSSGSSRSAASMPNTKAASEGAGARTFRCCLGVRHRRSTSAGAGGAAGLGASEADARRAGIARPACGG